MKIKKRYLIYLIMLVLIPLGLELLFYNYHPLIKQDAINIEIRNDQKSANEVIKKADFGQNQTKIKLNKIQYIKKISVKFDTTEKIQYKISVKYRNILGEMCEQEIYDTYYPELGFGVSGINRHVKSIQFSYSDEAARGIKTVNLTNEQKINAYRIVFFTCAVLCILLFIEKKQWFNSKLEWIVLILCLLLGSFMIYSQGVNENGWDEQIHFKSAYNMSFRNDIQISDTYEKIKERLPLDYYNTLEEKQLVTQYLNTSNGVTASTEKEEGLSYNKIGYIFQAIAIFAGRHLGLSFNRIYMLGKWVNLLTYALLVFWAIRLVPKKKEVFAAVALIPTQVFIASTYTYDVMVHGLLLLGFAMWMKVMLEKADKYTIYYMLASMLVFVLGALSKAVYIPLILLCCAIPKEKFVSKKFFYALRGCILISFIVVVGTFVIPALINMMRDNSGWGSDPRGGATDAVQQLKGIFKHIPQYIYILSRDMVKSFGVFLTGHEANANFGRLGELSGGFAFITTGWVLGVGFVQRQEETFYLCVRDKILIWGTSLLTIVLIWTSMYLAYTPVGATEIIGVQARYYLPLTTPLLLTGTNKRIKINMTKENFNRVLLGIPTGLLLAGIYFNLLKGYCF